MTLSSGTARHYTQVVGQPFKEARRPVMAELRGRFLPGSVELLHLVEGLPHSIFCVATPNAQGERQ